MAGRYTETAVCAPEPPPYKVYRSRNRIRDRLSPGTNPLEALRRRRRGPRLPPATRSTTRRVVKWVLVAAVAWILVSILAFVISTYTAPGESSATEQALGGGNLVTGSNILILGSDLRVPGTKEPGAATSGPSRSDSIMIVHAAFGSVRRLSILRDSRAPIPGHGEGRINSAYAIGGPPLAIRTVEAFLGNGIRINHVVEVDFANFPKLIDALGGIDVTLDNCIQSPPFSGQSVNLSKGSHHLDGKQALAFARVRKNRCAPTQDDRQRAARQQQVLSAMRGRITSPLHWPSDFFRGPFIAWNAPRAIKTDMGAGSLSLLFADLVTGAGNTDVLQPDPAQPFNADNTVNVTPAERAVAVNKLLGR
jgi:LCP family protein required for cell wall assembly